MKAGLYLSPWDRNNPLYGNSPRYNDLYCEQLRELLDKYGTILEVWFDGANGEGPNGKAADLRLASRLRARAPTSAGRRYFLGRRAGHSVGRQRKWLRWRDEPVDGESNDSHTTLAPQMAQE